MTTATTTLADLYTTLRAAKDACNAAVAAHEAAEQVLRRRAPRRSAAWIEAQTAHVAALLAAREIAEAHVTIADDAVRAETNARYAVAKAVTEGQIDTILTATVRASLPAEVEVVVDASVDCPRIELRTIGSWHDGVTITGPRPEYDWTGAERTIVGYTSATIRHPSASSRGTIADAVRLASLLIVGIKLANDWNDVVGPTQ